MNCCLMLWHSSTSWSITYCWPLLLLLLVRHYHHRNLCFSLSLSPEKTLIFIITVSIPYFLRASRIDSVGKRWAAEFGRSRLPYCDPVQVIIALYPEELALSCDGGFGGKSTHTKDAEYPVSEKKNCPSFEKPIREWCSVLWSAVPSVFTAAVFKQPNKGSPLPSYIS